MPREGHCAALEQPGLLLEEHPRVLPPLPQLNRSLD
jgi:hypothetical protein